MTIFDYINANEIGGFIAENPSNKIPYLGETLFPNKRKDGLTLEWIKGSKGLPVTLMPSAFDAKATVRERIGLSGIETEMPFFREAMRIGEKDRQRILELLQNTKGNTYAQSIIAQIFDDANTLYAGTEVQAERMRMQLLSTGEIDVSGNNVPYNYDYKFDETHKIEVETAWSDADSDPVSDITAAMDKIEEDTGIRPTRAICTRKTLNYLKANTKIKQDMFLTTGTVATLGTVTDALVKNYLQVKLGVAVEVYNKKYKLLGADGKPASTANQFFPDDVFTLIPDTVLGYTYYGRTPEEADLMSGGTNAQVRIVGGGIAITTIKEPHPVNIQTIVSAIMLPSFEQIDTVGILNVNPEPAGDGGGGGEEGGEEGKE